MSKPVLDPRIPPAAGKVPLSVTGSKGIQLIRRNRQWPEIQRHIIVGDWTAEKICREFGVKKQDGTLAIFAVERYRRWLRTAHAEAFSILEAVEAKALMSELQEYVREVIGKARESYEKAMSLKMPQVVGKGSRAQVVEQEVPDFIAAKEFLDVMLKASSQLEGVGGKDENPQVMQDNRTYNLLALPKAPQKMIEMQKVG